jgi:hypothetical protein
MAHSDSDGDHSHTKGHMIEPMRSCDRDSKVLPRSPTPSADLQGYPVSSGVRLSGEKRISFFDVHTEWIHVRLVMMRSHQQWTKGQSLCRVMQLAMSDRDRPLRATEPLAAATMEGTSDRFSADGRSA